MEEQKKLFVERAISRGYDQKKSDDLFELMAYFAGYGFNKSHSAAYALIAYQTAYLKANFPSEFAACLISLEASNAENMVFYLKEAKDMGIDILPPDINQSEIEFSIMNEKILFGLQGIKNIGTTSLSNIIAQRKKDGPFTDLLNFCERIDLRTSNKRVLEHLIFAGAFDKLPGTRAQKHHELTNIIELALQNKEHKQTGQMQLFSMFAEQEDGTKQEYIYPNMPDWTDKEKLEKEKEIIGFYISAHPLQTVQNQLDSLEIQTIQEVIEIKKRTNNTQKEPYVTIVGLLTEKKVISTKKGDKMAFAQVEDLHNHAEIIIFPKLFAQIEPWLYDYSIFIIKGNLDMTSTAGAKIKALQMVPLELLFHSWDKIQYATLKIPDTYSNDLLAEIKSLPEGKIPLHIGYQEHNKNLKIITKKQIELNFDILNKLKKFNISGLITL